MFKSTILIFTISIFATSLAESQNSVIDSIKNVISTTDNDSLKCDGYIKLFHQFIQFDPDSAQALAQTGLQLATTINYSKGIADLTVFDAFVDYYKSDFELSRKKMFEGLAIMQEKFQNLSGENNLRLWIANSYREEGKFDSAKLYLQQIIDHPAGKNPLEKASAYQSLANVYQLADDPEGAIFYYQKADSICEASPKTNNHCITAIANIGTLFFRLGNYEKASQYFNEATLKYKELGSKYHEALMLHESAKVDVKLSDYHKAEPKLIQALQYFTDKENPKTRQFMLGTLADVYTRTGRFKKSRDVLEIRKQINFQLNDSLNFAESLIQLGEIQDSLKQFKDAILNVQEGLEISKKIGYNTGISRGLAVIGELYYKTGDFKLATITNQELIEWNAFYIEKLNRENIEELETKYETSKKQNEIEKLTLQNKLSISELERKKVIQSRLTILISFLILGIIFLWYWMRTQRNVRELKFQQDLKQKNEMIDDLQLKLDKLLSGRGNGHPGKFISMEEINTLINFPLSDREYDVLAAVSEGNTNAQVSEKLFISQNTVKFHLKNIYTKLEVSNRVQALNLVKP